MLRIFKLRLNGFEEYLIKGSRDNGQVAMNFEILRLSRSKMELLMKMPCSTEPDNLRNILERWYDTPLVTIVALLLYYHCIMDSYGTVLEYIIHQAGVVEVRQMPRG